MNFKEIKNQIKKEGRLFDDQLIECAKNNYNKGRLSALKEEVEFLERIDLRSCDSIEVMDWNGEEIWLDKYVSERLASIQEEIKLIEGAI